MTILMRRTPRIKFVLIVAIKKHYTLSDGRTWKCASCRRKKNVKTGTMFAGSKIPLQKWFLTIFLLNTNKKRTQGRSTKTKTPVMGIVERQGRLIAKKTLDVRSNSIKEFLMNYTDHSTLNLIADEYRVYNGIAP